MLPVIASLKLLKLISQEYGAEKVSSSFTVTYVLTLLAVPVPWLFVPFKVIPSRANVICVVDVIAATVITLLE